ncbi:MAG TPA: hypothetical protein VGN28_04530 [Blastococcus sp.]|jgi:hypothetical protein|nr:hypothetical protein [Blastococcus sp.]
MNTVRRGLLLAPLTAAVILGASIPAWAAFGAVATVPTTIATITVAAPATVTVNDSCTTTTTVVKRTVYTDPTTGVQTQTAYSSVTTYATSSTNVQGSTSSTAAGPGTYETTTTTTTKSTNITVTASWTASASRGLSGYQVNAHLNDGSVYAMAQTAPGTLSTSQTVDAGNLSYQPRLSVTTLTSYGWTAQSALTGYISC